MLASVDRGPDAHTSQTGSFENFQLFNVNKSNTTSLTVVRACSLLKMARSGSKSRLEYDMESQLSDRQGYGNAYSPFVRQSVQEGIGADLEHYHSKDLHHSHTLCKPSPHI